MLFPIRSLLTALTLISLLLLVGCAGDRGLSSCASGTCGGGACSGGSCGTSGGGGAFNLFQPNSYFGASTMSLASQSTSYVAPPAIVGAPAQATPFLPGAAQHSVARAPLGSGMLGSSTR